MRDVIQALWLVLKLGLICIVAPTVARSEYTRRRSLRELLEIKQVWFEQLSSNRCAERRLDWLQEATVGATVGATVAPTVAPTVASCIHYIIL